MCFLPKSNFLSKDGEKTIPPHFNAWFYDLTIERLVRSMRRTASGFIKKYPVVDICCGTGVQLNHIAARGEGEVYGLDLDRRVLEYAQKKYNFSLILGDAAQLPFTSAFFGTAVISFALHDKTPVVRSSILAEVCRVLQPGGYLVLVDFVKPWDRKSWWGAAVTHMIERMAGREHYRNGRQFLQAGGLLEFIKQNGLTEIERHQVAGGSFGIIRCRFSDNR